MEITVDTIETEEDFERTLAEVGELVQQDPEPGTVAAARLDVIGALVEAYEREHYPMPAPDPIEAIRFYLEQQGADASELIGIIGGRARVWEVLNRKRPLTLEMMKRLHALGIPAESLLGAA
jgi:HTH-type transcriptional regulator / antitoxin HigA